MGIFCRKPEINGDTDIANNDNKVSCYHQMLPNELIKFLHDGAPDYN